MEKKAYLKPEMEVLVMGLSSILTNSGDSKVTSIVAESTGLGFGGSNKDKDGNIKVGASSARGNERNADGLSDWNIKLW